MEFWEATRGLLDYALLINIALAILLVFFERRHPTVTLTWILALVFMPVVGFVLYIFLGQDLRKQKVFYLKESEEMDYFPLIESQKHFLQCAYPPFDDPELDYYYDMIMLNMNSNQSMFTRDNKLELYYEGESLFEDLYSSLQGAQVFIHMQTYIINNDKLGRELIRILTEKAREGVEVKLLYDGMGCLRLPWRFFDPLIEAGGSIAEFFPPLLPYINVRINYRNHRKICVIDGQEAWVGGFNIGDEYHGYTRSFGFWRDTHTRIRGSAVGALEFRFLLDWRFASGDDHIMEPEHMLRYSYLEEGQGQAGIQIVTSGPDSSWPSIKHAYLKMITLATEKIYLSTPYLIPDSSFVEALKIAALSGIDTRVIIPGVSDHALVHWASLYYVGELLEAGVRCYIYERGFIHSKTMVSDGYVSSVGTANLDIRSFKLNFEVNAFIYDWDVARSMEQAFMRDLEDSREITLVEYENRSVGARIRENFSRLFSPLL